MPTGTFDINELKRRMQGATQRSSTNSAACEPGARLGVAGPVQVEAYGTHMPLNQLATISVPEPRLFRCRSGTNRWSRRSRRRSSIPISA